MLNNLIKKKKIIIAIDGFSSTGKSAIAKTLAKKLGYVYVDTGAMYRAVTLFAMKHHLIGQTSIAEAQLVALLPKVDISFRFNKDLGVSQIYLNGNNVEKQIRTIEVSSKVSIVAAIPEVRSKLVAMQQQLGVHNSLVMDGRDIGSVVFPNADIKLFFTASLKIRVARRYKELVESGHQVSYQKVLENIQQRDHIDVTRAVSPLKKAKDAIEIDNNNPGLEMQTEKIYHRVMTLISALEQKN